MSITPGTDNAPQHTPLMTAEEQQTALDLLRDWYDWFQVCEPLDGPASPSVRTTAFMENYRFTRVWTLG